MNIRALQKPEAGVSERMRRQKRVDTSPELALRRALHAQGLRYRVGFPVPGRLRRTIDIAFTRLRVAVFVDGCFWHACPDHVTWPLRNGSWWRDKLETNAIRDRDTDAALQAAAWTVVRIWEHESTEVAVQMVCEALRRRA